MSEIRVPIRETARLIAANDTYFLNKFGQFVRINSISGVTNVLLRFDGGHEITVNGGMTIKLPAAETFKTLEFVNDNGSAATLDFYVGFGEIQDDSVVVATGVNATIINEPTVITKTPDVYTPGIYVSVPTVTTTTVIAANTSRYKAYLFNTEAIGGQTVFVADAVNKGIPLPPQQLLELETTALLQVHHNKGSAVNIAVAEIERS